MSNFWVTLINCEINLILIWSSFCVITTFAITGTKLYVLVVTLSTQDNTKLLQQIKSGFTRKIKWNRYQLKVLIEAKIQYWDYLIDPIIQGVNRLFLSFENNAHQARHIGYFIPLFQQ